MCSLPASRAFALTLCLLDGLWLLGIGLWQHQTVAEQSWLLVLLGGTAVLYLPGMAASMSLGLRAASLWEGLGIWFFLSLCLALPLGLLTVAMAWNAHDTLALLGIATIGLALGGLRPGARHKHLFITHASPFKHVAWLIACLGLVVIATLLYRQGDFLGEVSGENALHATYMMRYAQLPALEPGNMATTPHRTTPTVIFLWEFVVALAGLAGRMDPLFFWLHGRMLLPPAIIGAFLFFMAQVLPRSRRLHLPLTLALALASGRIMAMAATRWDFFADRGTARFLSTFHHSDVTMDVVLPIMMGIMVGFCRRGNWPWGLALAGGLVVTYFLHPREFMQLAIYVPIILLAWWLLRDLSLRGLVRACRRLLVTALVFIIVGAGVMGLCLSMNSSTKTDDLVSQVAEEGQDRQKAWQGLRDGLSKTPMKVLRVQELNADSSGLIMILGMLAGILLLSDRSPMVRILALSTILCEFFVFSWVLSRHLLLITTYSEILTSEIRFLFWPFYVILPLAMVKALELSRRVLGALPLLRRLSDWPAMVLVSVLWGGLLFLLFARQSFPPEYTQFLIGNLGNWGMLAALALGLMGGWHRMRKALSPNLERNWVYLSSALMACLAGLILPGVHTWLAVIMVATSLSVLAWFYWKNRDISLRTNTHPLPNPLLLAGGLICFVLALWPGHRSTWGFLQYTYPPQSVQLERDYGMRPDMVDWLRTEMPIGSAIGVEPLSTYIPSLVKGGYTVPIPKAANETVNIFEPLYLRQETGKDPLYPNPKKPSKNHQVNEPLLWQDIRVQNLDFLLVSPWRAQATHQVLSQLPQRYKFLARFSNGAEMWKIVGPKAQL